jgi:type VI secretion system secreted protein VgrG
VIVDFLEGDPDRPIITGRVYNAESMPPFGLPDGAVVSGIKSDSHKGSGFNAITMDDTAGKEQLKIHGQYDMITEVQHDRSTTIKSGNDTINVEAGTRSVTVKGDTSLTVQAGSRTVSVTGGDYSSTASGAVKLHGKGAGVKITGDASGVTITGTPNVDISGASTAKVSSPSVDIGDAKITIHGSIVKIDGSTITISAKGGSVTVDASGVSISGSAIKSAASGVNEIKGSMVKLN